MHAKNLNFMKSASISSSHREGETNDNKEITSRASQIALFHKRAIPRHLKDKAHRDLAKLQVGREKRLFDQQLSAGKDHFLVFVDEDLIEKAFLDAI